MSFFADLFRAKEKTESVVLVDVSTKSVAGAYARYAEGQAPAVLYTRRFPVEVRENELQEKAMLRALQILIDTLIREGAPILMRSAGRGSADAVLISIDAPWQKTSVRTEHFEQKTPFVFTKSLVTEAIKQTGVEASGKVLVDESIIGTTLNGYETRDPYGKKASRAAVVVLTSLIDEHIAHHITSMLESAFHTRNVLPIAGSSLRFQAIQRVFPHERNALIIDATGPETSIAFLRKGLFVSIDEVAGTDASHSWVEAVENELAELSKRFPLPRILFLLAREPDAASLGGALEGGHLKTLWLSENPPKVVPVLASHVTGLVRQAAATPPDLQVLLMALFRQQHFFEEAVVDTQQPSTVAP
ncbi:MAG: hypothetical protein KGH56_01190 [Patescibacteria group bacterium]|nr:hypothetical protein [Patescibacteria group bacterium]